MDKYNIIVGTCNTQYTKSVDEEEDFCCNYRLSENESDYTNLPIKIIHNNTVIYDACSKTQQDMLDFQLLKMDDFEDGEMESCFCNDFEYQVIEIRNHIPYIINHKYDVDIVFKGISDDEVVIVTNIIGIVIYNHKIQIERKDTFPEYTGEIHATLLTSNMISCLEQNKFIVMMYYEPELNTKHMVKINKTNDTSDNTYCLDKMITFHAKVPNNIIDVLTNMCRRITERQLNVCMDVGQGGAGHWYFTEYGSEKKKSKIFDAWGNLEVYDAVLNKQFLYKKSK
jgi:hypothetical protein